MYDVINADPCTPQEQDALFKYMRCLLRFVARSGGNRNNEAAKTKGGKRCSGVGVVGRREVVMADVGSECQQC